MRVPHRFAIFCPSLLAAQGWHALVSGALNTHRDSIGLPPVTDVRRFLFTDRPWLAADPVLSPIEETGDNPVVRTGAWLLPDKRQFPAALTTFLDAGAPPVYVGFGSMRVRQESARIAIDAIQAGASGQRDWRNIVVAMCRGEPSASLSSNCRGGARALTTLVVVDSAPRDAPMIEDLNRWLGKIRRGKSACWHRYPARPHLHVIENR